MIDLKSSEATAETSSSTLAAVPSVPCHSCGKPASTKTWSAATQPVHTLCGRCALLTMGDTVGAIASVVLDLGADS
jgi:hypothetical protein